MFVVEPFLVVLVSRCSDKGKLMLYHHPSVSQSRDLECKSVYRTIEKQ
jgi:hypothetical protein